MSQFSTRETPAVVLDGRASRSAFAARLSDHLTLTKPGITVMVVITAFIGFAMGVEGGAWPWLVLAAVVAGTGLSCMGASVFNQVMERDTDGLMERTQGRP